MQAGELFVSLGIKGADKTVAAVTSVRTGMDQVRSTSVETKAALVGAFYAIQQLVSSSNQLGTNLVNTASILDMPLKTLQQYNYVAKMVGSSNEEMESTFLSLQGTMAKMNLGQGAPAWIGRLSQITGTALDENTGKEFAKHPEQLFQLLQKYAQLEKNIPWRNQVLGGFHLSGNLESGLIQNQFSSRNLNRAPIYSDAGVRALDANRKQWTQLGIEIEKSVGNFNVKYGGAMIKDIKEVTESALKLVGAFLEFDKVVPVFKAIDLIFKGWKEIFDSGTTLAKAFTGDKAAQQRVASGLDALGGGFNPSAGVSTNNNVTVNVNAQGNPHAQDIADKVKKGIDGFFSKKIDQAGRPSNGQGKPPL